MFRSSPMRALICLLTMSLAPAPAVAEVARPLVVDLTTLTRTPRTTAVSAFIAQQTPLQPGTYPLVSGSSPEFIDDYRWLHPTGPTPACAAGTRDIEQQLTEARALLVELELERVVSLVEEAYRTLPCQVAPVSQEQLRRLFYLEAVAQHFNSDEAAATRAFLEALAVDSSLEPLSGFPPDVTERFRQASKALPGIVPIRLPIDASLRQAGIQIDGRPLPASDEISLLPGRHMVQVMGDHGIARTAIFSLQPGESRQLAALFEIMPPGSASYLNALLRASLQSDALTPVQRTALDRFARFHQHPVLMFVMVMADAPTELALLTYVPEQGLRQGAPTDLKPLPPMQGVASAASAAEDLESSSPEGVRSSPERHGNRLALRLELGPVLYDATMFSSIHPAVSIKLWRGLGFNAGVYYGARFDTEEGPRSLTGLRVGAEYAQSLGPVVARAGLGAGMAAARITRIDEAQTLVLEATPELWLGSEYPLNDLLSVGVELGGGFGPGVIGPGESRTLVRGALTAAMTLP